MCPWQISAYKHPRFQWHRLGLFPALSVLVHMSEQEGLTVSGLRMVLLLVRWFGCLGLEARGRCGQGLNRTISNNNRSMFWWFRHPSFAFWNDNCLKHNSVRFWSFKYPYFSQMFPFLPGLLFSSFRNQLRHPVFRVSHLILTLLSSSSPGLPLL